MNLIELGFILTFLSKISFGSEDSLIQVHALFRSGDRTPIKSFFSDDLDENYFPYGPEQLTNKGKQTGYNLGIKLKQRYEDFLKGEILFDLFEARTTNVDRTKMTLDLVLSGLFPISAEHVWHEKLQWQGFPFKYEKLNKDKLLNGVNQPECRVKYEEFLTLPRTQEEIAQLQPIFDYVKENTGLEKIDLIDGVRLYFLLVMQEEFGLPLPIWTNSIHPHLLSDLVILNYQYLTGTDELKACIAGHFVKKVLDDSKAAINGSLVPSERKIFLYAAHEVTIASVLRFLDVFEPHVPKYGACVIVELHFVGGLYGFKFYYEDSEVLNVPGCGTFCSVDDFLQLFGKLLPS